jgi:hypothetical protein
MKTRKYFMLSAAVVFLSGSFLMAESGDRFNVLGTVHYFQPTDDVFKDVYGGAMVFGGEIGVKVWKGLGIWAAVDVYSKDGSTTFSEEPTEIRIMPITAGAIYCFTAKRLQPYLALGVGYFRYKETNDIGQVEGGDLGYIARGGARLIAFGPLILDVRVSYSTCKYKSSPFEADLGGLRAGLGIGAAF